MILINVRLLLLSSLIAATAAGGAREGRQDANVEKKQGGWLEPRQSGFWKRFRCSCFRCPRNSVRPSVLQYTGPTRVPFFYG
ncbi:unnamed protein product [Sphagnum jensenii]|uniref:Secreted protein n=1 Tax=Sphagnum jensenii TaxID=128206 RepID=A0ABP0XMB4_9BRYO